MAGESSSALAAAAPRSIVRLAGAPLPKYFTRDEVGRLLAGCGGARDRLIVRVMWETGVRVSELLALTPGSIDFAAEALRVATLKRRAHVRTVPLRGALLGELARRIAGRCFHTAKHRPWELAVCVAFPQRETAVRFERYLKSGSGRAFARRHF